MIGPGPYQPIFAEVVPKGTDLEQVEDWVRAQYGGTLDSLTREELQDAALEAVEVIEP